MESFIRGVAVYIFLWLIFPISGKRTLAETSAFELVLLRIISEVTNQAMVDSDLSITNAFLLLMTLAVVSVLLCVVRRCSPRANRGLDGLPLPLIRNGKLLQENMGKA